MGGLGADGDAGEARGNAVAAGPSADGRCRGQDESSGDRPVLRCTMEDLVIILSCCKRRSSGISKGYYWLILTRWERKVTTRWPCSAATRSRAEA